MIVVEEEIEEACLVGEMDKPPLLQEEVSTSDVNSTEDKELPKLIPIQSIQHKNELPSEMPFLRPITKHSRLQMAQLIEQKLQSENENNDEPETVSLSNGHVEESQAKGNVNHEDEKPKKPIIGCVRKSERRTGRLTKPPWLMESGEFVTEEEDQHDNEDQEDEDEDNVENLDENEVVNGIDMREKLCSQLQMLKVKKKAGSLFEAKIPDFTGTHYKKRAPKAQAVKPSTDTSFPKLGLKIVSVAGGVDLDKCKQLNPVDLDADENSSLKEVIINDHLDLPTIKLTKTKDYKKIKGWSKKKLLTLDADECIESVDDVDSKVGEDPTPSCSYLVGSAEETRSENNGSGNVFASNSLDGFLQEKDLNISYNVPNLKSTNHNINLLDSCVLVDVEMDKKRKELELAETEDSNSCGDVKEKDKEEIKHSNVYKPRTLAEKRKMMSDEFDGAEPKKRRAEKFKAKKFSRRPISSRFESPVIEDISLDNDKDNESLLIPFDPTTIVPQLAQENDDIQFLTEEESAPKDCVKSQFKFRSSVKFLTFSVVTRKPVNKTFYYKVTDIKRKGNFDLVPKSVCNYQKVKPSILKATPTVNYRPGPLCKKQELQVNGCKDWETVIVPLPKVHVEVKPQIGKKVDPVVRHFVKFDTFDVSKGRAEFALSVLVDGDNPKSKEDVKPFQFPAGYKHKQEKVMMRRSIPKYVKKKQKFIDEDEKEKINNKPETEEDILHSCEHVISKMLDYVEVKELEDSLLKYDTDVESKVDSDLDVQLASVGNDNKKEENKETTTQPKKKLEYDRVHCELRRLSVRTVNVPNDEPSEPQEEKPMSCSVHCLLGCVCHSISSRYPPSNHCGETRCIFNCVCGFEARCKNESKEDSKSLLNERTLSRFNKEAKRNITAREERDFTQTAIRSKNKTIILANNRVSKRTPKFNFKRFEGFHFSFIDDSTKATPQKVLSEAVTQKIIQTDKKLNNCVVNLVRCNFDDIVPYCLVHNLYDCHCKGLAKYSHSENDRLNRLWSAKHKPESAMELGITSEKHQHQLTEIPLSQSVHNVHNVKTKEESTSNPEGLSARMRGTGEFFRERNRTNKFKNMMARKLKYDTTVDPEIVNRWIILPLDHNMPKKDAIATIFAKRDSKKLAPLPWEENEIVNIDDDESIGNDTTKTRKKRKRKTTDELANLTNTTKPRTLKIIGRALTISGALYSPTEAISQQFSAMIGNKTTPLNEFRLLLWAALVQLYESNAVYIWISNNTSKLRFIITDSMSNPKGGYNNIREYEKADPNSIKVEFIKWIVTKTVPDKKNSDNILVILKINDPYWEICGICSKNNQTSNNAINEQSQQENQADTSSDSTNGVVKEVIQKVNEKYYKTVEHVLFANGTFAPKKLLLMNKKEARMAEPRLSAALPHILSNCRWRVLMINSNFAILAFTRNEFRIKCSDILTVMKVAGRYKKTIVINTYEVSANYKHKLFGLYVPPTIQDRIFIGPYYNDEEHGLETLRFVNNELMNTDDFNAMRGIKNVSNTGLWYSQYGRVSEPPPVSPADKQGEPVIDLTDMDEMKGLMKSSDLTITPTPVSVPTQKKTHRKSSQELASESNAVQIKSEPASDIIAIEDTVISIPKSTDVSLKSQKVDLTLKRNKKLVKPMHNGFEHVDVNNLPPPGKMPELIKIPLKANKLNKNITQANSRENMEELMNVATLDNIVSKAKGIDSTNLEKCFNMRLKIIMKQMNMYLPKLAKPICFRLNFGNGIILAYVIDKEVFVYWPGDNKKQFYFPLLENAVQWLSRELHEVFICIPSTFKIVVTPVGPAHYLEYINRGVISQKYFKEICIIGDFGIMRLSEAQKFLMYDRVQDARRALREAEGKSLKFKKAIAQIIDQNDMTKTEFKQRVKDLITKATAAADKPAGNQLPHKVNQSTTKSAPSEVICLDSDEEQREEAPQVPQSPHPTKPKQTVPAAKSVLRRIQNRGISKVAKVKAGAKTHNQRMSLQPPTTEKSEFKSKRRSLDNNVANREEEVMQIDLTHLTTERVKQLIRGTETGDRITLTQEQVKKLRALSRTPNTSEKLKQNGVS
ncbi:uncharacterized protein ocm [Atheta coriaria]|uniref:uncharacterized protein ocm n=1 Tax=Dalotia coriaria TaxID=877792 RepID=UPI0031F339FF